MKATAHQIRVASLVEAYKSGKTFPTVVKVRDFLGCDLEQAKRADLEARNELNRDTTTSKVVPAPKVPDSRGRHKGSFVRRSSGDADHDLAKCLAFAKETTSKAQNLTYQASKVSDKFPRDIDIMRFARDAAKLGQEATALKLEIERITQTR